MLLGFAGLIITEQVFCLGFGNVYMSCKNMSDRKQMTCVMLRQNQYNFLLSILEVVVELGIATLAQMIAHNFAPRSTCLFVEQMAKLMGMNVR